MCLNILEEQEAFRELKPNLDVLGDFPNKNDGIF